MLKLNTVITAIGALLLALLCFLGKEIWDDVKVTKTAVTTTSVEVQNISSTVADHETRLRKTELEVAVMQNRESQPAPMRTPKQKENP